MYQMTGTEKQRKWAEAIKEEKLKEMRLAQAEALGAASAGKKKKLKKGDKRKRITEAQLQEVLQCLDNFKKCNYHQFWIEYRDVDFGMLKLYLEGGAFHDIMHTREYSDLDKDYY